MGALSERFIETVKGVRILRVVNTFKGADIFRVFISIFKGASTNETFSVTYYVLAFSKKIVKVRNCQ